MPKRTYWFRAKRYGWGWGPPETWQGWLVFFAFLIAAPAGALLLPEWGVAALLVYEASITAALFGVCFWKGEPPRWRWGGED